MSCAARSELKSNASAPQETRARGASCRSFREMPLNDPSGTLTVVKLGGSLASKPQRSAWLDTLVNWGGPLLLVPGGGPFADCVRKAQSAMGFDDVTAHRLALIAMGQYGIALAAYSGAFALAKTLDDIE